ncbi:GNAT family N-acetyltransferase [Oceanomicrobium pacificus]|uniref:L-ornithine N(alpha)-acyltransferase n=1 Tax=Oceanomicrobium pacificus TaxID=2692916 RepID=A0A6B0TUQ2_9RHOB|nr:GNAT family N-acetyltransferase [Oceanomicrobium pacificus]MXU65505.1 GNAT family N-acetyltransferase [Oceanomicrobium pacificus]
MVQEQKPRYRVRLTRAPKDILRAQELRYRAFRGTAGGITPDGRDFDDFDARCHHVLVEETVSGALVCCYRFLHLDSGAEIAGSYSAQFYDLSRLGRMRGPMVEMGRFCVAPGQGHPDILRLAWAEMTRYVTRHKVRFLFGCSSFSGTEATPYEEAFLLLQQKHLAPRRWLPRVKAPRIFDFARNLRLRRPDLKQAMGAMPPLLRSYLVMGGWVSDHAVIDRDLGTLHVFTGLEVRRIPAARRRLLLQGAGV